MATIRQNDGTRKLEAEESAVTCNEAENKNVESRFECPICLTWLREPILTSCGHKFCSQCIYMWLRKKGACCPVDSKPLKPESDLFRDLYTSREISQQRTSCLYKEFGCKVRLSPINMDEHIDECIYKKNSGRRDTHPTLDCPFKDVGCLEHYKTQEGLERHLEANINAHLTMVGNALPTLSLTQARINARALESQLWDPPPKNGGNGHSTDNNDQNQDQAQTPSNEWQQLLKNLYERIVVLEQQNRELSITVANQQTKLTTLQTSMRFNQDETIARNCNGVYIWRLNSFFETLTEIKTDRLRMVYSPGFYTSPNGYKICARINVSPKDPEFLSILLHMMQSENDDALDWPFDGTMRFVLVHPQDVEKSIREETSSRPDLEAFRRPVCDLNKRSFGYTEFVRISELPGYVENDCLIFRIQVMARHDRLETTREEFRVT